MACQFISGMAQFNAPTTEETVMHAIARACQQINSNCGTDADCEGDTDGDEDEVRDEDDEGGSESDHADLDDDDPDLDRPYLDACEAVQRADEMMTFSSTSDDDDRDDSLP